MHTSTLKQIIFVFISAFALTLSACDEEPSSENGIQQSLNSLLIELQIATMGSNVDGLEAVEIKKQNGEETFQARRGGNAAFELILEVGAIGKARQSIMGRIEVRSLSRIAQLAQQPMTFYRMP